MTVEINYVCPRCKHIHNDEVEGDFEKLPEDFKCRKCGTNKQEYISELWHSV